jgi:lipopolysaccharide transport system ATP-binding protein
MFSEVVIEATGLGKGFDSYARPSDRLKQSAFNFAARISPIGSLRTYFSQRAKDAAQKFWALRNFDLEVRRGETIGIIGRNGSGKSTLLQMICGTLSPSEGNVVTHGRVAALLELGSGFDVEFTGRENVYINGQLNGLTREQIDERFEAIRSFADIGDFIDQPVKTYSSGMFVRLAFAVIAHVDADILVVDEALAVGDAFFTQKCMRFLRQFMQSGTILFVSHDSSAVRSLCTKAIWLERGKVIASGDPKSVCNQYLEAYYEAQQGKSQVEAVPNERQEEDLAERDDQRSHFLAQPEIDVPPFTLSPVDSPPCDHWATVESVRLLKDNGEPLTWTIGGEMVSLRIVARSKLAQEGVVVGFVVKDKLGRTLFGDNTYWETFNDRVDLSPGESMTSEFTFAMPVLMPGDYAIDVAIAVSEGDGDRETNWQHGAYFFRSEAATSSTGLVGIPMLEVSLSLDNPHTY